MHKTQTLMAAAILSLIALTGNSQAQVTIPAPSPTPVASPTPDPRTGTYNDPKLSVPQRLQIANAILASGTADASADGHAVFFILNARPVIHLLNAFPQFDAQVLADPTLSGTITDPNVISILYWSAVKYKTDATPVLADKVAYLQPLLSSTTFGASQALSAKQYYASIVYQQGQAQYQNGDYASAIATVAPVLGWNGSQAVLLTFQCKVALRASDALAWAKLVYIVEDFQHTQTGIDAVSSAFRALDTNLVRANAFIQYQKDGQGTNPIASVTVPKVTFLGNSVDINALNAPDSVTALKVAVNAFATAPSGTELNTATAFVAQWLRNIDTNLVRANAFVSAQSQGQAFTIAELQAN
jgi:hypothetical protein